MIHILFIIPYKGRRDVVQEVLAEHAYKNHISWEIVETGVGERVVVSEDQADAVVSRGYTAITIQTPLPTVELSVTGFDMMRAVEECVETYQCRKIAVIGTFNMVYGADSVNDLKKDVEVICCTLEKEEYLEAAILKMQEQGCQAFIGGRSLYKKAEAMGVPAVILGFGREAVRKCVGEAIRAVQIRRIEQEKSARIQTIMDYTFEGILSTDEGGGIIMANQYAHTMLGKAGGSLAGQPIEDFFPVQYKESVLREGGRLLSKICRLEKMTVSVNWIPLKTCHKITGSVLTFQDITEIQKEEETIRKQLYQKGFVVKYKFEHIIGESKRIQDAVTKAKKYANSDSNLFIYGETGTGKELFAQSIHNASRRKSGPFIALNCAALPENLLESELFGYVEGAFTGAAKGGKKGLFELAHNGTIFLDEIGDLPLKLQARLLRVIQEKEIMRLGHDRVIPVNVRVISASNKELHEAVSRGQFREDLLYRLNILCLNVPPLRRRGEDSWLLAGYYIDRIRKKGESRLMRIDEGAKPWILNYQWPGNVRELRNFCERLTVFCEEETAGGEDVQTALYGDRDGTSHGTEDRAGKMKPEGERETIIKALEDCRYSRKKAAALLGIDVSTLFRKMKKFEIMQ